MSRSIADLHPDVQLKCKALITQCGEVNIPLMVVFTLRTFEEQEALYAHGRSRPGPIVTWARGGHSWHNFGRAFDICFKYPGKDPSWDGPWWEVGQIGEGLGLEWGGRWEVQKRDRPHFQYTDGLTLDQLRTNLMVAKIEGRSILR